MTNEQWTRRVDRVMDHVRDNPAGDHSLDALAGVAQSSPFHFHRIFRAVTGETVGQFVQRARLERAAYLMKSRPSKALTDVAFETGFASSQEFSRTFRRNYGLAPSQWDRRSRLASPEGRAEHRPSPPIELGARLVERGPIRLAYVRVRPAFDTNELASGLGRLVHHVEDLGVDTGAAQVVGMSWDNYETTPMDRLSYDLGVGVPPGLSVDSPFGVRELPSFRAIEIDCDGPLQRIAEAWDYLYETWFPESDFEPADLPAMKWFAASPREIGWDRWQVACSIALRSPHPS